MEGKWCSASHPSIPLSAQQQSIPSIEKTECHYHLMVPLSHHNNGSHPFFPRSVSDIYIVVGVCGLSMTTHGLEATDADEAVSSGAMGGTRLVLCCQ
jgi:hypothetical protein